MSASRVVTAGAALLLAAVPAFAQQSTDRSAHHPGTTASPPSQAQPSTAATSESDMMANCREMMGRMAGMHGMMGSGMMGQGMMGSGMMGSGMTGQGQGMGMGGPMMGQGMGGPGMMMRGGPARHVEGRLAFLKTELKITDAQMPQWNAFADAVRANAKSATEMRQAMMASRGEASTLPERLAQREKVLTANLDGVKRVEGALDKLYAALDADQKKVADGIVIGPMGMPMGIM